MGLEIIITGVIGLLTTITSAWASYFFTKRKYNVEVEKDLIDNLNQTLDFYIKLSDDNGQRLEKLLAINEQLEKEVAILKEQVEELTIQLRKYKSEDQ